MRGSITASLALVLVVRVSSGQDTGSISGDVSDVTGAVLPGTRVAVHEANGALAREQATGPRGGFNFPGLPVGRYRLTFERAGFAALTAEDVLVEAGADVRVDATLELQGVTSSVEAQASPSALDRKRTGASQTVDRDLLQGVPNGRNLWVVLEQTPGVVLDRFDVGGSESGQQSLFSATGTAYTQNQYFVNGVNATDPAALGASSTYYSYDSFEEIQISTSGHSPSVQSPGVFLNIVLKSGGNEISGGASLYFENEALQSNNLDDALRARGVPQSGKLQSYRDFGFELGGPIVRDRAFFYGNFARQRIEPFVIGFFLSDFSPGTDLTELTSFVLRATATPGTRDRVSVLFVRNNKFRPFREAGRFRPLPETTLFQDSTTDIFQALYSRLFGDRALVEARFSRMDQLFPLGEQPGLPEEAYSRIELSSGLHSVGPGSDQLFERRRWQLNASLDYFSDDWLFGSHDLEFGWEQSVSPVETTFDLNGAILYRDFFGVPSSVELYTDPLASKNETAQLGLYARDVFVRGRLVLDLGVRFDHQRAGYPRQSREPGRWDSFFSARGVPRQTQEDASVVSFDSLAPRFGFTYTLTSDGRTLLRGSYGRYAHQIGTDLGAFANPNNRATALFAFDDVNENRLVDPGEIDLESPLAVNLPGRNRIASDIEPPLTDEWTLGIEREIAPDFTGAITLIYRKDRRLIDDVNVGVPFTEFTEDVALDPGRDLAVGTDDDALIPVFNQTPGSLGRDRFELTNPEGLDARYRGVRFEARKRYRDRWQVLASLTVGESEGFLPGPGLETAEGAGFATPLFDSPNSLVNAEGRTFWDRPRILRLSGSYDLRWGIRVAAAFRHQIGQPLYRSILVASTQSGTPLNQGPIEILAEPQGNLLQPNVSLLDLRAEKEIDFGRAGNVRLVLDLFNAFNANTATEISSRRSAFGAIVGILPPRVARIGVSYRF